MNPTDCAVCEHRTGTTHTPDGRLVCPSCAKARPDLMKREPVPLMDAYASFVGLVVENRARRSYADEVRADGPVYYSTDDAS
jgi:hypothetical protein